MAERPLYTLYKNLKAQNYDVPDDYNKFESALTRGGKGGADNRHAIYENLKAQNFDVPSTYERFYSALFEPRSRTSSRAKGGSVPMSDADRARFLAGAQSVLNTARQVKRASGNIRKTVERAKKFNANDSKVTIGFKNPLQNQNVQKNEFNYNSTTGKTGTYTTTDGVEFDNEYDASHYQNQLDKQGQQYINAVNAGEIPSAFDVRDKKGNYDLQENIGKNGTYLTEDGAQKQFDKKLADAYARKKEIEALIAEDNRQHGNPLLSYGASIGASNGRTAEQSDYRNKLATSLSLVTEQIGALEAVKQYPTSSWGEDALKALDNTAFTAKTWDFGLTDFAIMGQMERIKTKMDNNIPLSGSDKMLLKSKLGADAATALEDEKMGNVYRWTKIAGQSLPFMADFFLTGGYGGITKGISRGALKFAAKRGMGKVGAAILKNTGIVAGDVIGSYAMAGTEQALKTGADIMQRHLGNLYQDEKGDYKFGTFDENGNLLHEGGESIGTALYKGMTSAMVENYTEKLFGHNYGIKKGAVNFMEKHGMNASAEFFKNIGKSGWYTNSKKWMEKFGINGFAEEVMEEEIGIPLHALLDGEGKVSDLLDAKQQLDIIGGMAISVGSMYAMGAGSRPVKGIYNRAQYYRFRNKVNVADIDAQNLMGDNWADIKDKIDNATNEQMGGVLADILRQRDTMTKEQINAAVNYGINLMKMRGYNIAKTAEMNAKEITNEPTTPEEQHQADIDNAYSEGHDADDADKHDIQIQQEDQMKTLAAALGISEQQLSAMSDEELESLTWQDDKLDQAIYDYQLSSARYQGVVDDAQDKVDLAAHQAEQRVDMYTDQSRGSVRNATIKASGGLEDYGVYIISGNIATHDDGSIDVSNSDDMILYYDPTTNSVEHADALMFAELGEELPADEVKVQAVADAKENAIKEVAGIIDGTVEVGSQFNVTDTDGTEHTYEVLADYGDGTAAISIDGNVVENPYSLADLQKMKDLEDQKRLETAKAEREQMEKERAAQQTQNTEETQPSFDFNQILNDNGNVVLVDVLGKDGNTKYPDSRLFLIRDAGAKAKVVELKSDGTIVPHAVNKEDVATISSMSLDEYKQAMPESPMIEDNSGENRGEIEVETPTIEGETPAPESAETPATEQTPVAPAITLEDGTIVPMLEDGNPDFSKLTAAQTAELYDSQFGEDADSIVSGYVSDAKKALDKASNMTVKGKTFVEQKAAKDAKEKAIADAQAAYDSAIAIRDAYNERQLAKVEDTAEGRKELIEKARRKFARLKSAVKDDAEAVAQIYKETVGTLLHRLYDGTGIDVTDTIPLTAEEYVASNLGAHSLNYEGIETSKGVKQETGLSREDFAKTQLLAADGKGTTIDALVHSLWENRPSNLESLDTQDIRNALIGVLNSGFKASEARNFVENIRIVQAENILEEQKRAQENAAYAEQHKAEPEAELKAKSDEKAELKAKSEEKLDNESSNESNDLSNETDNEKINDNINDNINTPEQTKFPDNLKEGSKTIEVPEDATDEKPLGEQRTKSSFLVRENGKQQTETESDADVEKNKVDDIKVVDNIVRKKTRKTLEKIAKIMGANIQWLYSNKQFNGKFDEKTNTIYLTLDSSITEGVQFIFGHEMTHEMRTKNPAAYDELKTLVKDMMGEDIFSTETDKMQERYKKGGARYWNDRDAIEEEVVADQLGSWIRDANYAHTLLLKMSHPLLAKLHEIVNRFLMALHGIEISDDMNLILRSIEQAYVKTANGQVTNSETGEDVSFSLRQKPEPKKKGIGYKVFVLKDGKLYPPMVANPDGAATPVGVWLDADAAPIAGESKTGRPQVKQGGKGTQGGSGRLAYRPGWHLGVVPYAIQFNRKDAEGNKTLFPKNFVFAEVEYAADVDYQEEARQEGINPSGKYQHSLAGLKHLPTDGYYMYRTNPNPETDPWVITGAMKVNRILTRAEQAELVKNAGREPQQIQEGDIVTDDVVNSINQEIADAPKFSLKSKPVRYEAGKKLSDEEKKEVLSTLTDAYKVNGVPYHIEETAGGKEKRVYEPTADSYVVSDITNRPLRYYITLPDGRVAHPTEVYPNISDNEVKSSATKQGLLDDEADQIVSAAIGNMKGIADNAKVLEVLTEMQNLPHETHDVGYGMNNAQSYNYKTGIFTSDAAQAIDYVVRRMRRKEDVPAEIPAALKKAVDDSYGMVDNLIDGMSNTKVGAAEIKPVGVGAFGNIYNQFRGKAKAAIGFLKKVRGGEAVGALYHKDIGDIDLVWGKEGTGHSDGYGLSKLVKYHPEVLDNLQEILNDMRVVSSSKNRVNLESETRKAGVRLTWDGERKSWLLTAFKKETSASDKRTDTAATSLEGDTALSQTEGSAAKIDNSSETAKENGEKVDVDGTKFSLKDEEYLKAVEDGNMEKAQKMVNEAADAAGYSTDSSYQGTSAFNGAAPWGNGYFLTKDERKEAWDNGEFEGESTLGDYINDDIDGGNLEELTNAASYRAADPMRKEAIDNVRNAIQKKAKTITMYRSVPSDVKEGSFRNGDWVTPSRAYAVDNAKLHGWGDDYNIIEQKVPVDDVWFDGNDIAEWGYGREEDYINDTDFAYKNSKNNKKLLDAVTYDDNGNVIPLSQRFNEKNKDVRFSFAGERGAAAADKAEERTFRMDNLSVAKDMEKNKKKAKAIKAATGWERGADGKWRYEMPDVVIRDPKEWVNKKTLTLSDIVEKPNDLFKEYPELFDAYPKLKDVKIQKGRAKMGGSYYDNTITLNLGGIREAIKYDLDIHYKIATRLLKRTLVHEVQHYIQHEEGFAKGGSEQFVRDAIKDEFEKVIKQIRGLRAEGKEDEAKALAERNKALYNAYANEKDSYKNYKSLSGEVEARNVSARLNMTPEERRKTLAESTEDVARKDQIFLGVGDVSFSLRDMADGKESGAADMAEDLKSLNTPDEVDDAIKTAIEDMPSGWKMANKKMIHIAQALGENRKAEIAGEEPKFSLKDGTLIKAGTYFSGGGLVEEGLKGIIDPVVAVEYDEKISGVYRNNFGQHIVTADVRDVDPKELVKQIDGEVEYFHASPVCKNYSQAKSNHAEVELDKETAASTAEFINAIKPKVVTIENVKGYKDSEAMKTITDALDANGYTWDADVYNAADYGGYTNRERLIVRAVRDGKLPAKPEKMARKSGWYEAVADIIPTLTEKKNGVAPWMDIRLKADGIDWRNIDKPLYVMGSAYADGKIPHAFADELLPTLRTKSGDVIVMPDGKVYRAMGRVLARVSGVSDDYKMPFSENLSHTIIGNGIPTQLTEHVIAPLLTSFDKFDFSHMGEGEGSQAFGWGGYVTNSKDIAEDYTRRAKIRKDNGGFEFVTDMSANNKDMVRQYIYKYKDVNKGLNAMRKDLSSALEMFPDDKDLKELSDILEKKNEEIAVPDNIAYLYDVDIPDDNGDYLDWDAPLTDKQKNTIIKELRRLKIDFADFKKRGFSFDGSFGGNAYDFLMYALRKTKKWKDVNASRAVSKFLSSIGFTGIKYKAGTIFGGAKEGDYNYVIFDENNANIVGNTRFSLRYDKFEHDLNQWKKDNNLPKDAQRPTIPQRNAGESAVDFLRRVDEYRKQMALWKTAPTYEQHLLSDDTALGEFNRELQRGSVLKRIAFQDSMLAIRKAQEAIMKEVGVDRLNMAEDAYTAENRSHGKGKNEFEEYNNEFLQPLRKAYHQMKKVLGDSYDNVRIYMMAKHGLERDAQMAFKKSLEADYEDVAQRSAAYKAYKGDMNRIINDSDLEFGRVDFTTWRQRDNALRAKYSPSYMDYRYDKNGIAYDYSGLSALFDGSDFEEAAYKLVKDIEDKYVTETHTLWDATNAATKKIIRDGYKAGMMSKDTYQYVRDMYSHYIPLRGWDGTTADQVWDYIGGGKGAFNHTLKKAHGRTSIADDPIAYIENMAESGILLNNKNWVKQHLMLLAQNHPTSLLTLSKAWYVKSTDANGNEEWIPATPQISSQMNSNQVKAAIDAFEKKMEQMAQAGDATQKRDGLNIAYPQTHSEEREHEVRVMKDGDEYVIYVNGDPQLAQAMNNTRAHRVREIQSGKLDRAAAWLGRKMAAAYTSLSPLFIPSNYFRDLTMTLASTAIREDGRYNYLLRKNLATSWNLGFMLRDYQNGKLRDKVNNGNATPKEQMFYDFMMNGGETGFVSSLDVEDLKKKFKNDLKDLDRWKTNPVKVGHTIMDGIEFLNRAIEDSNRFAVYMTSIQYGRSIDEAVNDAKDVTLNFNRKGTGEYGWQMIRNLYLFINPAVQSLQTLGALAKHHPFKFTAVTASWLASGVLVPIVNAALMSMLGGDDDKDKYWQFTKWDRRNNLIMWVPYTHEYVKIPLAQEFRAFYGIGDMIASKMMGGELAEESWSQYAEDLLGQVVDMLPLDPTGYDGNIAVSLMPNAIRPVFELAFNVDFTGKPLFKETEYNKYDPNFTKAYVGTPDWLVRASRMVNSIGNDYPDVQQNSIDAFGDPRYNLNNPAVVDHVLSSYLGGAYTMGSQVLGLLTKSLNDPKEIKVADIPLFSKFVSNPDDRPVTKKQGDEFWNMKENHDRAANTLSKLKKQAKVDGDYSMLERFYGSEEYKKYKQDDVKVKKYEEDKKKERAEDSGEEYRPHKLNAEDIYKAHATPKDDFEDLKLKQLYTKLNGFKTSYDLLVDTAPSQSDGYYNNNKAAIDAIDEISLDKQEISELKKGFLDDGKDAYNAEDMKQIRDLRKKILSVLEKANKVVVANQKAKAKK